MNQIKCSKLSTTLDSPRVYAEVKSWACHIEIIRILWSLHSKAHEGDASTVIEVGKVRNTDGKQNSSSRICFCSIEKTRWCRFRLEAVSL